MFDSQKIDAYFNGAKPLASPKKKVARTTDVSSRFVKLGFPCIAAALLGVMIIMPNIKKSVDIRDQITLPRKSEMEKLHAEQVVLNTTDSKNRVNKVWADNMDELEIGSEEITVNNPRAEIASDNGIIFISADVGTVNQNTKILHLTQNVKAVDEENNSVQTAKATYEFETEYGYGDEKVYASGDWGNLTTEGFTYDKNKALLILLGNTEINTDKGTLRSNKETHVFPNENKVVSIGNAVVERQNNSLFADKIINYFSQGSKKTLLKTEAFGKVKIVAPKGTATAQRAVYLADTGIAELFDDVVINTEKGIAKGSRAVYNSEANTVDLYGNVVLEQGDNFMHGQHIHTDLNTSISTMTADKKQGARVSGVFYKKRKAENGKKTN